MQAGSTVRLLDVQDGAAAAARGSILAQWDKMLGKGRLDPALRVNYEGRLLLAGSTTSLAGCDLVVEAVVERLDVKTRLFAELESIVGPATVLATNTSSLSVTALAATLAHPERFAGFHFFNPVPLMKVVEVVAGLKTDAAVCAALSAYAAQMGHRAVLAQDSPGFIVNHAGRGYGTEALRISNERVADFATVDRVLRDQAGFRLGPFELMDLTALDVSHPVMESIYHQYFEEPRYRPSVITAQRLAGGVIGRKVGEGFYRYQGGIAQIAADPPAPVVQALPPVWIPQRAARRDELLQLVHQLGGAIETGSSPSANALALVAPLGFDVTTVAVLEHLDAARTVGIDMLVPDASTRRRVIATNPATRADMRDAAHALLADRKSVV